jgi:hypothetical protein
MWIIGHAERRIIGIGDCIMTRDADENAAMNALFIGMCGRRPVPAPTAEPEPEPQPGLRLNLKPGGSNESAEINSMFIRLIGR